MNIKRKYIKIIFPFLLSVLMLQVPFLHFFFEPYPNLTLPRGTSIIRTNRPVSLEMQNLFVEDQEGRMHAVNLDQLLPSIPENVRFRMVNARFGLDAATGSTSTRKTLEARAWLSNRLREADGTEGSPQAIHIHQSEIILDLRSGAVQVDTTFLSSTRVALTP